MGQKFRHGLCGFLFQGLSQAAVKVLTGAAGHLSMAGVDPLPSSLMWLLAGLSSSQAVDQRPLSGSCHVSGAPQHGSFLHESMPAKRTEVTVFCNLITKVTSHHFSCILLLRSKSPGSAPTQEEEIIQGGGVWGPSAAHPSAQ